MPGQAPKKRGLLIHSLFFQHQHHKSKTKVGFSGLSFPRELSLFLRAWLHEKVQKEMKEALSDKLTSFHFISESCSALSPGWDPLKLQSFFFLFFLRKWTKFFDFPKTLGQTYPPLLNYFRSKDAKLCLPRSHPPVRPAFFLQTLRRCFLLPP